MSRTISALIVSVVLVTSALCGLVETSLAASTTSHISLSSRTPVGRLVTVDFQLTYVAALLGVTSGTLQRDLHKGQTLLQVGARTYHSPRSLAAALLAGFMKKLRKEVAQGVLTKTQQQREYTALLQGVSRLTITTHPKLVWLARWRAMGFLVSVTVR